MPEHKDLPDGELHELKGAAGASTDQIPVADGAGNSEFKGAWLHSWEDQNDSGSSQSLTNGSWIDLTNDGAGPNTDSSFAPGYGAVWDTVNDQFDFDGGGLEIGDAVVIRLDVDVTTTGSNQVVALGMDLAHGDVNEFRLSFIRQAFKSAGTFNLIGHAHIYMGNNDVLNNPAKVIAFTDAAGNSLVVNGWYTRVIPQRLVLG